MSLTSALFGSRSPTIDVNGPFDLDLRAGSRLTGQPPHPRLAQVTEADNARLRITFDEDAELYDRVRPGYPYRMFDDLAQLAGVGPGCRVLEIGAGTGIATVPLAGRGCRITAVELGANMAAVAARKLAAYPDVEVVVADFEEWPLRPEPFDLVLVATAYHWLDPAARVGKVARALKPGGALAVVETHHIAGGDERFFADAQGCYERFDPATPPGLRLEPPAAIPRNADTDASADFRPAVFRRYEWEYAYATHAYLDLLMSYSGHRALPAPERRNLLDCIAALIDGRHGGRITKRYLTQLWVAHRS
jgi:SAM-dependent methyltransferase